MFAASAEYFTSIDISGQQQSWALLTPARSEQLLQFLNDEQVERLSAPKIVTISDQSAFVEFESINAGQNFMVAASMSNRILLQGVP